MTEVRHIVFDLGNVLLRWEPERPYRRLIPDKAARRRFMAEVCNGAWLKLTDRGVTWPDAEADLIARFPDEEALIRAFRPNWSEMVPGPIEGAVAILEALAVGEHDLTALTNFADDTFDAIVERFAFISRFRGITVSARVRLIKPDSAIYHRHADDFALDPAATLFFDDIVANVEGARSAGWHAEVFTDAVGMRADLKRYGIVLG